MPKQYSFFFLILQEAITNVMRENKVDPKYYINEYNIYCLMFSG